MFILAQTKQRFYTIDLSKTISGSFHIYQEDIVIAEVRAYKNKWQLCAKPGILINHINTAVFIKENEVYVVGNQQDLHLLLYVKNNVQYTYKKYTCNNSFSIGRNEKCDINYNNPFVSNVHAEFVYNNGTFYLHDHQSTNYTYVNGLRVTEDKLVVGDIITIMGLQMILGFDFWAISVALEDDVRFSSVFKPYENRNKKPKHTSKIQEPSVFRAAPKFQKYKITLLDKKVTEERKEMPLWLRLGPSMCMGIIAIVNIVFTLQKVSVDTSVISLLPSLLMSFSMVISACLFPLLTLRYQKNKLKLAQLQEEQEYQNYLNEVQKQIEHAKNEEKQYLEYSFPSLDNIYLHKMHGYSTKCDFHFLKVRIGLGNNIASIDINDNQKFSLTINDIPIYIDITKHFLIGIMGDKGQISNFIEQTLVLTCFIHSPLDLKIACIGKEIPLQLRWLPHLNYLNMHCFIEDEESALAFQEALSSEIKEEKIRPTLLIILFDFAFHNSLPIIQSIKNDAYNNISIFTCTNFKDKYSHVTIDLKNHEYQFREDFIARKIVFDNAISTRKACRFLANIPAFYRTYHIPSMYPFLSMFHVACIEELNVWKRWEQHNSYKTLKTPIGIHENGQLLYLDIHEKKHGPHGLLAGMTGSGKTECILTYVLSMAINFHPKDVQFLIIDFKGGGLAKLLESLPHTVGVITNLDDSLLGRFFISLQAEILKRQNVLKETAVQYQMANLSLNEYQKLYYEHKTNKALSHLIIICDEFAELKNQQPLYMDQLISTARIGRSLGIHLLLATQKPSGIVNDQIWSNTHFHLCMKVADKSDSMDMIHRPDSAFLHKSGQFYLQIGNNETFMKGQSAWAQAPYDDVSRAYMDQSVKVIDRTRKVEYERSLRDLTLKTHETQFEVVIKHLVQCAKINKINQKPIWLPPLTNSKDIATLSKVYKYQKSHILLGEIDDPENQCYRAFYISLMMNSLIYASNDQKQLLETFITSYINYNDDKNTCLFCIDMFQEIGLLKQYHNKFTYIEKNNEIEIESLFKRIQERKKEDHNLIFIILHGFSLFENHYSKYLESLFYALKQGSTLNVHFLITARHEDEISYRLKPLFTQIYVLYMERKEAMHSLLNCQIKQSINYQKGRGYYYDHQLHVFQVAYVSNNT